MAVNLYRATVHVTAWNGLNVNVFHFDSSAVLPASAGAAIKDALSGFYGTLESDYPTSTTFALGQIIDLSTDPTTFVPFDPANFDLSPSGQRSDARQAATITWRTSVATRRGRGRTFVGPLDNTVLNDSTGVWTDAFVTDLNDAASNLISAAAASDIPLMVYSRKSNSAHLVTAGQGRVVPHTLRSRTLA